MADPAAVEDGLRSVAARGPRPELELELELEAEPSEAELCANARAAPVATAWIIAGCLVAMAALCCEVCAKA